MAGLSGGFDGKYTSLKNVPELPEDVSLQEYRSWQNQIASEIAENQFELGLTQINYPDGFYDVFVDQSKIASSSNVSISTGTNGSVKLAETSAPTTTRPDDNNPGTTGERGLEIEPNSDLLGIKAKISSNTSSINRLVLHDTNGNQLAEDTSVSSAGDVGTLVADLSSGTKYYVWVDAGNIGFYDSPSFPYTGTDIDITASVSSASGGASTGSNRAYSIKYVQAYEIETSGSITSTDNNLGYSGTEVTVSADYTLNGQSLSAELQDASDDSTITTIQESDIGTAVSISTSATSYNIKWNLSGNGSDTPKVNKFEVGLDD